MSHRFADCLLSANLYLVLLQEFITVHGHLKVKFYKISVGELEGKDYLGEIKVDAKENHN